ncbi:MAG: carboxypeptidase regulatory-like domain-containing protein [Planctomycetaceae bacterium]|nr:carboxypeptidase regulatory-like domain-containing protein [Planctomycetaceae bacterium]
MNIPLNSSTPSGTTLLTLTLSLSLLTSQMLPVAVAQDRTNPVAETPEHAVRDVVLDADQTLELTIVNISGNPQPQASVEIRFQETRIAVAVTDEHGRIRVSGMRPGVHVVTVDGQHHTLRLWTQDTAPPNAIRRPALIADESLWMGQYGPGMYGAGPGMLAVGVTTIAVVAVLAGKSSSNDSVLAPASP